eukprot:s5592_g3.t1
MQVYGCGVVRAAGDWKFRVRYALLSSTRTASYGWHPEQLTAAESVAVELHVIRRRPLHMSREFSANLETLVKDLEVNAWLVLKPQTTAQRAAKSGAGPTRGAGPADSGSLFKLRKVSL